VDGFFGVQDPAVQVWNVRVLKRFFPPRVVVRIVAV
jgi:hypothetical protein